MPEAPRARILGAMLHALTPDVFFRFATLAVVPFWLLLVLLPRAAMTRRFVHSAFPGVLFGTIYVTLLVTAPKVEGGGLDSLSHVLRTLREPWTMNAGWVHWLVFDLFVGSWISRDALRRALPYPAVVPCLLGAFWLGPVGLLAYLVLRVALRGERTLVEEGAAPPTKTNEGAHSGST